MIEGLPGMCGTLNPTHSMEVGEGAAAEGPACSLSGQSVHVQHSGPGSIPELCYAPEPHVYSSTPQLFISHLPVDAKTQFLPQLRVTIAPGTWAPITPNTEF